MAIAGGIGAVIDRLPHPLPLHALYFGEDQARYLIATADPDTVLSAAAATAIPAFAIGHAGGDSLDAPGIGAIPLSELRALNESWLPAYMAAGQ
jgi:phosphoribosylformylglycinamidine synthase